MFFPFYIARRYLLSKKSHHAINVISAISVCGVAVATAALVCILSVFNGFQDMIAELFTAFDPQLKVLPYEGKFMASDEPELERLRDFDFISVYTETLEDNALLVMGNRQVMATIKGVSDNFDEQVDIDKILYGGGVFQLHADVIDYGVLGINLLMQLGVGTDFTSPVQVYAPRKGENINLNDPRESFNNEELYSPKVGFMVKQNKYDSNYAITSLSFARRLFERQGYVSAVELKLADGVDAGDAKEKIRSLLGQKYKVLDRYEQQEDTFKIMKIEKLISYIFLTFILLVACFNIIGSLSMLVVDKKKDVRTLRNLGADNEQIASIFLIEGRMIAVSGAVIGIVLGLALCLIQQNFGIVKFGTSAGNYIIDAYPVSVHTMDIIIVFITVLIVGFLSVWYPVRYLSRKFTTE
ncbi:MAG: FtsX-like permease family protein [Bacteroides sp.]|nr:FtsX-like permease family protein [Roseburia sp.]MCM1346508.1 FtsX-like permease family protein [Bacteroides sp.]MCM1421060.1 FtsX-like permease family protein [Bacteroides sp.]